VIALTPKIVKDGTPDQRALLRSRSQVSRRKFLRAGGIFFPGAGVASGDSRAKVKKILCVGSVFSVPLWFVVGEWNSEFRIPNSEFETCAYLRDLRANC
jgi:hypothetical protein